MGSRNKLPLLSPDLSLSYTHAGTPSCLSCPTLELRPFSAQIANFRCRRRGVGLAGVGRRRPPLATAAVRLKPCSRSSEQGCAWPADAETDAAEPTAPAKWTPAPRLLWAAETVELRCGVATNYGGNAAINGVRAAENDVG